jgi:hypothetical protein
MNTGQLRAALVHRLDPQAAAWLEAAEGAVARDPAEIRARFPQVGRRLGRDPLVEGWTVDDAGRALLLVALGPDVTGELADLYRYGDAAERRGVLRALDVLDLTGHEELARGLVADALRTNDLRLVGAALGTWSVAHLGDDAFAHAVLKCVFSGVPLAGIPGLAGRATPGLARMLASFAHERIAAGRTVPAEIWPVIDAHPPAEELAAITEELSSPVADRRQAAAAALAQRG